MTVPTGLGGQRGVIVPGSEWTGDNGNPRPGRARHVVAAPLGRCPGYSDNASDLEGLGGRFGRVIVGASPLTAAPLASCLLRCAHSPHAM